MCSASSTECLVCSDSKFAMPSSILIETPEKTAASTAGAKASSPNKAAIQLQSEDGGAQSADLDSSDDDGLPCVHEGRCKGGCSRGGFSQRNTLTSKGILRALATADVQSSKRKCHDTLQPLSIQLMRSQREMKSRLVGKG